MYTCPGDVQNNSGNAKPAQHDPSSSPTNTQSGKANVTRPSIHVGSNAKSDRSCCALSSSQSLRNSTAKVSNTSRCSSPKRCALHDVAELAFCPLVLASKKPLSQCKRSTEGAIDPICILVLNKVIVNIRGIHPRTDLELCIYDPMSLPLCCY